MPFGQNVIVDELKLKPKAIPITSLSHKINEKGHSFIKMEIFNKNGQSYESQTSHNF